MSKYIQAVRDAKTDADRFIKLAALAKYLRKHSMAVCMASADELADLKAWKLEA